MKSRPRATDLKFPELLRQGHLGTSRSKKRHRTHRRASDPFASKVRARGRRASEAGHSCRRFEVPTAVATDSDRNFKSKSGTRNHKRASAPLLPKFVPEGAAMYDELRKRGAREQRGAKRPARGPSAASSGCCRCVICARGARKGSSRSSPVSRSLAYCWASQRSSS